MPTKAKKFDVTFTFRPAAVLLPRQLDKILDRVDMLTLLVKADSSWAALDTAIKLLWKRHVRTTEYFGDLLAIQIQKR